MTHTKLVAVVALAVMVSFFSVGCNSDQKATIEALEKNRQDLQNQNRSLQEQLAAAEEALAKANSDLQEARSKNQQSMSASQPAADVRPAQEIAAEATLQNDDPVGRPLPLLGHWNTGQRPGGFNPDWQMSMIQHGHHLLPWFQLPAPGTDNLPESYYEGAIMQAAQLQLPISFVSTQWEHLLTDDPAYFNLPPEKNPNVVTPDGKVLNKVSPFGPVEVWYEVGRMWAGTEILAKIQQWYPDPPLVLFVSNNEHARLTWREVETSARYLDKYGKGRDDEFKRKVVGDGWIERFRALQQGIRDGLNNSWKDKAVFIGYEAFFGPAHFGRSDNWIESSLTIKGRINPWPLAWGGNSPSYYIWSFGNDNTLHCPQIESMNWNFMLDEAWKLNPKFWWEISVWDGHQFWEPKLDEKRKTDAKANDAYSPARYGGFSQFGMWLLRPRVVREFRGWLDTVAYEGEYTQAIIEAIDRVYRDETLRQFWRKGKLVANPAGRHPYQSAIPEDYQTAQRWFLLNTDLMPPKPWTLDTKIPVFALALELGQAPDRQWLVYAHAPSGPCKGVKIDLPGFGLVTADVAVAGRFLLVNEANKTVSPMAED